MRTFWENNGEKNEEGKFVAVLEPELDKGEKGGVQRFEGDTHLDVANKLMTAQANATVKIAELAPRQPVLVKPAEGTTTEPLTANEHFTLPEDLKDPEKAAAAIVRVVEAKLGKPVASVATQVSNEEADRLNAATKAAATEFQQTTPEYFHCTHNAQTVVGYMVAQRWDLTVVNNYKIAFERLMANNLLVVKPEGAEETPAGDTPPETPAGAPQATATTPPAGGLPAQSGVTTRPRGVQHSSGLRAGDSSALPSGGGRPAPKYTAEQLERMGSEEYNNKLRNEAGFAEAVAVAYQGKPAATR